MIVCRRWITCALALCVLHPSLAKPLAEKPAQSGVASANAHATQAGLAMLAQGGNAFDAAIAVSAVLAVVEPYHTSIGGGGFWLLHDAKKGRNVFLDGREIAPLSSTPDQFLNAQGDPIPGRSLNGGLATAIPGEPAALVWLASHYGRMPLKQSLAPAIRLAEEGFEVDYLLHSFLRMGDRAEQLAKNPAAKAIFFENGAPLKMGATWRQPQLARTLRLLAEKGFDGFYRGEIAEQLVAGVNQAGGRWTLTDLARYQVKEREPLEGWYHDMHIVTAPLPSAGGVALITMLNILSAFPLNELPVAERVHYLVEAMRMAYWQRQGFLGDSDVVDVPVKRLLSHSNANYLRTFIQPKKATPSQNLPKIEENQAKLTNTTHFSILDEEGNRVAATLSVNYIFGASVVADKTGVLLNNHMDDFAIKPQAKNVFGIPGSTQNAVAPGKRPLSSMTPTFLENADRLALLGTPGGSRIPTMVLLASLIFEQGGGAISMVSTMRFHHQFLPDVIEFEPDTFSTLLQSKLKAMGYALKQVSRYYGDMQAVTWDRVDNLVTAASDPRRIGMAAAITLKANSKKESD